MQKQKICTKKLCTKTVSPQSIEYQADHWKQYKSLLSFFASDNICKSIDAHYCDTVKRKKPPKKGRIRKNHENWFYENWLFQEERPLTI